MVGFAPEDRPRIAVASDGTMAAIQESNRAVVVDVPGCAAFSELALDAEAKSCELGWVGTPPRLIVLSRYAERTTAQLIDPFGSRTIATLDVEAPARLVSVVGPHALAIGPHGAWVLTATDAELSTYPFPARGMPIAAGAAGSRFVVAFAGMIEEWDPQARIPQRRIKLPRPVTVTAVGGSDRVVWYTTQQEPARVDVSPFVDRGQPKKHDVPEPIATIASHPTSDLLACVGAHSGRVYVIDLDAAGMRVIGPSGIDRAEAAALVIGRSNGVLAAQAGRPIALASLDGELPRPPTFNEEEGSTDAGDAGAPGWREALVAWVRAGAGDAPPDAPAVAALMSRFELPRTLYPALTLLYAAHLAGQPGAAPIDVARVLGHHWPEALGRGQLAARGLAVYAESRVRLAAVTLAELDARD